MSTEPTRGSRLSRRAFALGGFAAAAIAPGVALPSVNLGRGTYRSLALTNWRTEEWLDTVYWVDGEYIPEALEAIDHMLRDWREDLVTRMDRRAIDILSATQHLLDTTEPFEIVSGYRSEKTNRMLRRQGRGVARKSYHVKGMAVDITMKTRTVRQISGAGLSLAAGGVGKYSRSEFVHLDSGPVRDWGR